MSRNSEIANLIRNKVKSTLLIIFIGLFILSSCPLRQTINFFLNITEAKAGKDFNKDQQARTVLMPDAVHGCARGFKTNYAAVTSSIQSPDLKTPVFFLASFAPSFNFVWPNPAIKSFSNTFGQERALSSYSTHIKNCLFLI